MADLISKIKGVDNVTYDLQDKISTFGGTNYVLNSNVSISGLNLNEQFDIDWQSLKGKIIVVSCYIKLTNAVGGNSARVGFEPSFSYSGGNQYCGIWHNTANGATDNFSGRISAVYTVNPNITGIGQRGIYIQRYSSGTIIISHPKIEIGTKPTEWTPAPQDLVTYSSETLEFFQ